VFHEVVTHLHVWCNFSLCGMVSVNVTQGFSSDN